MKTSELFTKTRKSIPADEQSKNAQLLIRAGFVDKQIAGVYAYLPLGKMVLDNIIDIIRQEMNAIGGNEINMTVLQSQEPWQASGRWDDKTMDNWFKTQLVNGQQLGLAPTHEEPLTHLMKQFISSYHDLPVYVYQFQTKFRNELRARSGLLRGREFLMKDLYSFSRNESEHDEFYQKVTGSYEKIFKKLGLGDVTYKTFASGGSFSTFSHEFQTVSSIGEDTIFVSDSKKMAINKEVASDETFAQLGLIREELNEVQGVEVGNIFTLGTKYSEPLGLIYTDQDGHQKPVFMGSYGIGVSRLFGLIAEHFADEKGLVWPKSVAPFLVYLVQIGKDQEILKKCQIVYHQLEDRKVKVLWNDCDERPGVKFNDADLMGIPYRLVISQKTIETGKYELKKRTQSEAKLVDIDTMIKSLAL